MRVPGWYVLVSADAGMDRLRVRSAAADTSTTLARRKSIMGNLLSSFGSGPVRPDPWSRSDGQAPRRDGSTVLFMGSRWPFCGAGGGSGGGLTPASETYPDHAAAPARVVCHGGD